MMNRVNTTIASVKPASTWGGTMAGFAASLVGIGLARFAYTPLLPALIGAHWFDPSKAAYLGAANLAGYLAGAIFGRSMAARTSTVFMLRAMMLLASVAFFACAWPVSFAWFFTWRFLSGTAGGALMVLAAPTVLAHVTPSRRGLVAGIIFMGVGVGIAASGTLVPLLPVSTRWVVCKSPCCCWARALKCCCPTRQPVASNTPATSRLQPKGPERRGG